MEKISLKKFQKQSIASNKIMGGTDGRLPPPRIDIGADPTTSTKITDSCCNDTTCCVDNIRPL